MAALLGLATGGAAAFLGQKHLQKVQNEQMHQAFQMKAYMDAIHQDPTVINNPEFVKGFKKIYGEGSDDFIASVKPAAAKAMRDQQTLQDTINLIRGVSIGTRIGGGQTPQFNQPQDVVRGGQLPGQLPTSSVQGPAQRPSIPAPQISTPTEMAGGMGSQLSVEQLEGLKGGLDENNPQHKSLISLIDGIVKAREFEQGKTQQRQEFDIAHQQQLVEFQSNQQLRRDLAGQSNALRQEMQSLRSDDQKNQFATRTTDQLSKQSDALIRQFSDPNKTYDQKTRQNAVNNWNRHVQSVFDAAERQGVDLGDADAYRLDVGSESGGILGYFKKPGGIEPAAPSASVAAARPAGVGTDWTQGSVKGRQAWISPDRRKAVFIGG